MSDNNECVPRHRRRRRRYRVLAVVLVVGAVMGYSVILLEVGVGPVWLVPIITGVVTAALRLVRGAGGWRHGEPSRG
jgi:hypothetical protein